MSTAEERRQRALKIFGGPAGLAAVEAYVNGIADAAPPLTTEQKARLRILLRPAPAAEPMPPATFRSAA